MNIYICDKNTLCLNIRREAWEAGLPAGRTISKNIQQDQKWCGLLSGFPLHGEDT